MERHACYYHRFKSVYKTQLLCYKAFVSATKIILQTLKTYILLQPGSFQ